MPPSTTPEPQQPRPANTQPPLQTLEAPARPSLLFVTLLVLLFAAGFQQRPLYASNQNTYFLHGLAAAGVGHLSEDWLAHQTDHIPVFSALVFSLASAKALWLTYLLHGLLAAAYVTGLVWLAHVLTGVARRRLDLTLLVGVVLVLHSPWLLAASTGWLPAGGRIGGAAQLLAFYSTNGLAGQYVLGSYLQPSSFGVLLLVSVACFVTGREKLAVAASAAAATMHPTYALHAVILTGVYGLILLRERHLGRALRLAALSALFLLPIVWYVVTYLGPESRATLAEAQAILVDERIPRHAKVAAWFARGSVLQLLILAGGLVAAVGSGRLFRVLLFCMAGATALSVLQVLSGSNGLALLFPWRLSVWILPLSTVLMLTRGLQFARSLLANRWTPGPALRASLLGTGLALLVGIGLFRLARTVSQAREPRTLPVLIAAKAHAAAAQLHLIPLEMEDFRLATGLPAYVDWKSHPYRDVELLEWSRRVGLARAFYEADSPAAAAAALTALRADAPLTHVIIPAGPDDGAVTGAVELFATPEYRLLALPDE